MGLETDPKAQRPDTIDPVPTHGSVDHDAAKPAAQEQRHLGTLDRKLKSRHVQFLALSGAIGTGLFVGSGQVLSLAGPLSAFLSYAATGFNLFCVVGCLGEMAAWLPVPGAVPVFAARYADPALGFTLGWNYWYQFAVGVPIEYLGDGALGRFLAFWKVFIQATFSYGGSEMVVVASGETENPRRNIPKAIRRVFWRILLFYVLSIFLVGLCVSSKDEKLLNAIDASAPGAKQSPFVIAISNAGIKTLPSIINGVILTSAWSAGNSFFYASTRVLYSAALDGKAPAILRFERFGVPYVCVAATTALSSLVYLNVNNQSAEVFFWISNLSAVSTLIVWASVSYTYLRFYHGLRHHGVDRDTLPYKSPMQPFLAYFAIVFCLVIAFFNGFDAFFPGKFSAKTFLPPYIDIPIFLGLFLGYKFVKKTKFVPLAEMDLWSGKAEIDRLEGTWVVPKPRNFLERIWFWLA
ncbi:hypothetical protein LLEC1_05492 [Akanthomyces lecanii]|uniref:Amino acid permease/ SLC12A domain-containing protein n=1 Tax=Cordyceps confragosa TaxID=2714763 RepID=A0A179I9F7_CORDF|nr:hypothetical protein LLEC1_05492 [Akanthomyces lecanii]